MASSASAKTYEGSTTAEEQGCTEFTKTWSKTVTMDFDVSGVSIIAASAEVGFNTWATDEDYIKKCYAPAYVDHWAGVRNSKDVFEKTKLAHGGFNTGTADVVHEGTPVTYYIFIEA